LEIAGVLAARKALPDESSIFTERVSLFPKQVVKLLQPIQQIFWEPNLFLRSIAPFGKFLKMRLTKTNVEFDRLLGQAGAMGNFVDSFFPDIPRAREIAIRSDLSIGLYSAFDTEISAATLSKFLQGLNFPEKVHDVCCGLLKLRCLRHGLRFDEFHRVSLYIERDFCHADLKNLDKRFGCVELWKPTVKIASVLKMIIWGLAVEFSPTGAIRGRFHLVKPDAESCWLQLKEALKQIEYLRSNTETIDKLLDRPRKALIVNVQMDGRRKDRVILKLELPTVDLNELNGSLLPQTLRRFSEYLVKADVKRLRHLGVRFDKHQDVTFYLNNCDFSHEFFKRN
jgi:hypothetical protein